MLQALLNLLLLCRLQFAQPALAFAAVACEASVSLAVSDHALTVYTRCPHEHTSPRGILQEWRIYRRSRQMHISHHTSSNEHILD